jgi:hypothetical protein
MRNGVFESIAIPLIVLPQMIVNKTDRDYNFLILLSHPMI